MDRMTAFYRVADSFEAAWLYSGCDMPGDDHEIIRTIVTEMLQMQQSSGTGYVTTGQADRNEVRLYEARERAAKILRDVRRMIREQYVWPGGYKKILVMANGEYLCHRCASENYKLISAATRAELRGDWQALGIDIYWEGPTIPCAHCGDEIHSESE